MKAWDATCNTIQAKHNIKINQITEKYNYFEANNPFLEQQYSCTTCLVIVATQLTFLMGKSLMKSITACLSGGILNCPLGLFWSLHIFANIVFGAIP